MGMQWSLCSSRQHPHQPPQTTGCWGHACLQLQPGDSRSRGAGTASRVQALWRCLLLDRLLLCAVGLCIPTSLQTCNACPMLRPHPKHSVPVDSGSEPSTLLLHTSRFGWLLKSCAVFSGLRVKARTLKPLCMGGGWGFSGVECISNI
jgi:hypothetical protein